MKKFALAGCAFMGIVSSAWAQVVPIQPTAPVTMTPDDQYCTFDGTVATTYSFWVYLFVYRQDGTNVYTNYWYCVNNTGNPYTFRSPAFSTSTWGLAVGNTYRFHAIVQYSPTNRPTIDYTVTVTAD